MHLLFNHQLKTTSGLYREIKIDYCPVTVHYIDVAHKIWVKIVPYLKEKTTRNKHIHVAGNLVHVLEDLVKIHEYIYLTAYLFFVNGIPLFITLSSKILFTAVNYLASRKVETIFKDFKEAYSYYMKRGFYITNLYANGNFPHYKPWSMSTCQGDLVSISQVQMNTFHILNAKSELLRK